jgi:hypothetical protein
MNRGSLPIGKILLIAAVVIALIVFVRPLISGMGADKETAVSANSEMSQGTTETVAPPADTQMAPEAMTPSDSTAPNSEQMTPVAPTQETVAEPAPATVSPTTN